MTAKVVCPDCDWEHVDGPGRPPAQAAARAHEHGGCYGLIFTSTPEPPRPVQDALFGETA